MRYSDGQAARSGSRTAGDLHTQENDIMLFANANLFVDGRFPHGAFRGENGRLTDISAYVAASDADLYARMRRAVYLGGEAL